MATEPRVVAELGRPETPEETAARKAESSRKHRSNQTLSNLVLALAACLGIVLLIILVVVRPDAPPREPVDFNATAAQAQPGIDVQLATPTLPPGWNANSATISTGADGITTWSLGLVTPKNQFIGLKQGIDANATWVSAQLEKSMATGTTDIDGVTWTQYDRRSTDDPGNLAFAMTAEVGASSYVAYGTADDTEFTTFVLSLAAEFPTGTPAK